MALVSPGVEVTATDESFFANPGQGTIPFIMIATAEDKPNPGNPALNAPGTTQANADKLFLITSQRELIQTFGEPTFAQVQGTPQHGNETNEYGLWAAYSYMGISNRAYVMRADLNLDQLQPEVNEPRSQALNGTYWLDTGTTNFGIFRSIGSDGNPATSAFNDWSVKTPFVVDTTAEASTQRVSSFFVPTIGDALIAGAGDLVINGVTIPLAGGEDLSNVGLDNGLVQIINNAVIPGIEASVWWFGRGLKLVITNTTSGSIDLTGSDSSILIDLGLGSSEIVPDRALFDGETFFAVVTIDFENRVYEWITPVDGNGVTLGPAQWYLVGTDGWRNAVPSQVEGDGTVVTAASTISVTFSLSGNTTSTQTVVASAATVPAMVADLTTAFATEVADQQVEFAVGGSGSLVITNNDGGSITVSGPLAGSTQLDMPSLKAKELFYAPHTNIPDNSIEGDVWIKTTEPNNGADYQVAIFDDSIGQFVTVNAPLFADDTAALAALGPNPAPGILYVEFDVTDEGVATHVLKRSNGVSFDPLVYVAQVAEPTNAPLEGTLWYNTNFDVDIMVSTGTSWVGLNNHPFYANADIILNASKPTQKPVGSPNGVALVENDIWIDTSNLEDYPIIRRYRAASQSFELVDNTDQTTPFGIVFADARQDDGLGNEDSTSLANSDFVDPDAPNPLTFPNGFLLWNTRFSTLNVKEWQPDALLEFTEAELLGANVVPAQYEVGLSVFPPILDGDQGRWVTISGNQNDGAPNMARNAQRAMVVRRMAASIAGNEELRAETVFFNLIATPGYPELIDEMVTLNFDKKEIAFIIGDTPARLAPSGTSIQSWATNAENAPSNGELALTTRDTNVGIYYPWGLGTNIDGFEVMVPPSAIALRTIAFSDSVSYPWFAPAGFSRGRVSNVSSVGFLNAEEEYNPVILNQGQRDVLQLNDINPIAFMPNQGLVVFGQKTLHPVDSALDRVNVVRLVNFLRYNFDIIAKPFLFEPNDQITRDSVTSTFERFLGDLVGLRALLEFAVVCDSSNNTPERIDRNELWIDIAIKPVKSIEFIFIPIRVLNTGDDLTA